MRAGLTVLRTSVGVQRAPNFELTRFCFSMSRSRTASTCFSPNGSKMEAHHSMTLGRRGDPLPFPPAAAAFEALVPSEPTNAPSSRPPESVAWVKTRVCAWLAVNASSAA